MKNIVFLIVLSCFACKNESKQKAPQVEVNQVELSTKTVEDVELEVYNFDALEPLLHIKDDNVHVINFWATWCAPCIKELPYFERLKAEYASKNVEFLLVSLDFEQAYETKLKPFIITHNLQSKVVALNDPDSNTWIPKVNETWSGSIPATIIYSNDKYQFYEKSFTYEELKTEVNSFLN